MPRATRLSWIVMCAAMLRAQPPTRDAVEKAVGAEFGIFTLNATRQNQRISPAFVTGDFDGDGRADLAALVSIQADEIRKRLSADPGWSIPSLTITKTLGKGARAADVNDARDYLRAWKPSK